MRYNTPKFISLGLLSLQIIWSNANPVVRTTDCVDASCSDHSAIDWAAIATTDLTSGLSRRAGGRGRPDKPDSTGPNGGPGGRPDDPNNPSDPGAQNGEAGGFDNTQETTGGFTDLCEKRSWFSLWSRAGCGGTSTNPSDNAPAANNPTSNTQQNTWPPSIKNNNNQPATLDEGTFVPGPVLRIDVDARRKEFEEIMGGVNPDNVPWFFYSGVGFDRQEDYKNSLAVFSGLAKSREKKEIEKAMAYMGNVVKIEPQDRYGPEFAKYRGGGRAEKYFWAANSKAYAQAVRGHIYVTIPGGRPINQPYANKGSNWWSYEVPELTRNPNVESITVFPTRERIAMSFDEWEDVKVGEGVRIWTRGDEPIGYPGDEHKEVKLPEESWSVLPEAPPDSP
ncbi:hypothetical protein BKA66DRAFT_437933 [Pyrenochaeta sp. MPI-SDFR-AT-0127]|nr:hypothetical protein BKA66DRAFT_437933 [Pyrenochaeta sp. MPI-SDFR-AT-0127]